jgi:hypothetical protein
MEVEKIQTKRISDGGTGSLLVFFLYPFSSASNQTKKTRKFSFSILFPVHPTKQKKTRKGSGQKVREKGGWGQQSGQQACVCLVREFRPERQRPPLLLRVGTGLTDDCLLQHVSFGAARY